MRFIKLSFIFLAIIFSIPCFAKNAGWEGTKLSELTDVDQQNDPSDGDTVVWDDTLELWKFSAGGYTNLTQFVAQTAWRSFYSDGSGNVKELAFGDAGKILTSNGVSSAPTWETPAISSQWSDGTDSAIYYNDGNVGIGTSAPSTALSVVGDETITGDILVSSGKGLKINEATAGYGISYDGVNGTTTITNKSALHPASKQITVDIRLKFSGSVPTSQQLLYLDGTVGQARTECTIESLMGGYGILGFSDGVENYYGSTSLEWVADTWYILRYTWDGNLTTGNIKAYRDNVLIETWDGDNPFPAHNSDAWLAALPGYGLYNRMVLDEVRVSSVIRSDTVESSTKFVSDADTILLLHMDEGTGTNVVDSSSNNFTCTNSGGTTWVAGQVSGGTVDKNLIKRTSASPVTNSGTLNVGYSGDSILLNGNTGIGMANTGLASLSIDTIRIGSGTSNNYVLTASSNGVGTWQASQGTVTGSGSADSIPKFATGSSLANSIMAESGTTISVGGGMTLTNSLNLLTNNTGIAMTESVLGKGLSFNGSSDSLTTTYKSALNLTGARTYELWFQDPSPAVGTKILVSRSGDFMIGINNTNSSNWNVYFFDGTSENYLTGVGSALNAGEWHHLAITWDRTLGSNQLKAYVDGALWAQATDTNAYQTNTNDLKFSIHQNGSNFYPSIQDEIRISNTLRYTGTFTPTTTKFTNDANTILLLHLDEGSGNPADSSSNNFTNTLVDAPDYVTGNVIDGVTNKDLIKRNSSNTYIGNAGENVYISGNVGIGTTAPVQKLQVNGRVRANDFISDQTATFAYNGDGTVNTITKGTRVLTFSYNGDGTINTVGDGALTSTFSYNGDGTIAAITKA